MDLVAVISQVGFPIAVAIYSLLVLNKTMNRVAMALERLCVKVGVDSGDSQ